VFAAASLKEAFGEIAAGFERAHPSVEVVLNLAGSQQLAQQLAQGARADVFASANQKQLGVVREAGRVAPGSERAFARNKLVVIQPARGAARLRSLSDLRNRGLKLILAAPEVPAGQYARDFLAAAAQDPEYGPAWSGAVLANVVSNEESVRAVVTKVALGEADAGVVYQSDLSGETAGSLRPIPIPDTLNQVATYPIAVVRDAQNPEEARAFVEAVLAPGGQSALQRRGFLPGEPGPP
jgi:molybdate transport system substrate-binding protein